MPDLSAEGEREAAHVLAALGAAGVLAPEVPRVDDPRAALADHGEPFDAETVLSALGEADWWQSGLDLSRSTSHVVRRDSRVEQDADTLRAQAAHLLRLLGRPDVGVEVELLAPEGHTDPTRVRIIGAGDGRVVAWAGHLTYLSTHLPPRPRPRHRRGQGLGRREEPVGAGEG